jgi:hypothetical protein
MFFVGLAEFTIGAGSWLKSTFPFTFKVDVSP